MRMLVLGVGKTGRLVASVAAEHGHGVHVLDATENKNGSALTAPFVTGFDVIIDFTTPEAVVTNMRACLATGARMVIGTTGWYEKLPDMEALAQRRGASLLFGSNFSLGVQMFFKMAGQFATQLKDHGYQFAIAETHHAGKMDAPSGTAITLRDIVARVTGAGEIPIESIREGEAVGLHVLEARSPSDNLTITHESASRRTFAEGAVRAAEWLAGTKPGVYDFQDIFEQI